MTTRIVRIYVLRDPRGPRGLRGVRYVGKTEKDLRERLRKHLIDAQRGSHFHCHRWIRQLLAVGLEPTINLLWEVSAAVADAAERDAISRLRDQGARLTNMTDGGEGPKGHSHSWQTRVRLSIRHRGRTLTAEHRARIGEGIRRHYHADPTNRMLRARPGHETSPETRAKIGAAHRGRVLSAERRAQISAALSGRKQSQETIDRRRVALKGRKCTPEEIRKRVESRRRNAASVAAAGDR